MGNCLQTKASVSPSSINITPQITQSKNKNGFDETKQVSIPFLKLLIDKNNDIDTIINIIEKSVFKIQDIVESVSMHMELSHDFELEMYKHGKSNIRVYFTPEQNHMLFELVKMLMKYKKQGIIKQAQDECRDLSNEEELMLLL